MRGPSFFNPTAKTALLEDAEICGFTTPAPGFPQGNPVIQQDFRRLLDLFDGIDPQTAALLVIGVRMKLARQVVALAAMEKTGWRVRYTSSLLNLFILLRFANKPAAITRTFIPPSSCLFTHNFKQPSE